MNGFVRIREFEESYTSTEKLIAKYILEHGNEILNYSAQILGEKTNTSAAAIIRFSKKIGFKGFSDLKMNLAQSHSNEQHDLDVDIIFNENDDMISLVDKGCRLNMNTVLKTYQLIDVSDLENAINLLCNASTIYLFGVGGSSVIANDIEQKLIRIGKKVIYNNDLHIQMTFTQSMTKGDTALIISYSGTTAGLVDISKILVEKNIPYISITQINQNLISKNSTVALRVPSEEKELRIGAVSSRISSFVITDLLYYGVFKKNFDKNKDNSKMMLILCGSSMSYMEDNVLAYKAPLYGRRTAQMKILPFDFKDSCKYFNRFSAEDMALIYGIVGGTPQYLLQMNDSMSVEDNIKNVFLNPASAIFEEPENLLKQEVREPAVYNAIITAVATGSSRMSEIATKIGETTSVCSQYMKNLINLGLIRKETPYGEKESRKSIYAIADNMFRFWYRFIPDNNSIISRGATELAYKRIAPNLSDYMGRIFEEICMQYMWKLLLDGESPVEFSNLGRWWGTDPQERIQTEIDIMGDQDKSTALFGECKWINENVDVKVLEKLKKRSRLFRYENVHLFLFAKKGFTQGCIEEAGKMGNVSLVTYDQIYEYLNDRGITAF